MSQIVLPALCLLLFVLIAARKLLTAAFRQLMGGKSPYADEQFREIIEREKQRMKDDLASTDQESGHPDPP